MNAKKTKWTLLPTLLLGGCYPMEQAPLVYTSRQQMGVNVSGGTTDNPGLELSIGYKGVDAAFVPVMVAKHCPETNAANCDKRVFYLQKILGRNDIGDESSVDAARIAELQGAIRAHEAEVSRHEDELKDVKAQIADIERMRSDVQAYTTERDTLLQANPGVTASAEQQDHLDKVNRTIEELNTKIAAGDELQATQSRKETEIKSARSRLSEDRNRLKELQERRNEHRTDVKEDALSVFGSFDGDAGAAKESANLGVGKVFSTGVASQNLTQGLGKGAAISLRAKCIATVAAIAKELPHEPKAKLLSELADICTEGDTHIH